MTDIKTCRRGQPDAPDPSPATVEHEPAAAAPYRLLEKPSRVYALDVNGIEICGARQPIGHPEWIIYAHRRVHPTQHQVVALTRDAALQHVTMIADLYTRSAA